MRQGVDAKGLLDKVFSDFAEEVTALNFQKALSLNGFQAYHSPLVKDLQQKAVDGKKVLSLATRMYLTDLGKNDRVANPTSTNLPQYDFGPDEEAEDEHLKDRLEEAINRHLRWCLVSAFEQHERFVKDLYAAVGFLDVSLWQSSDLGNESIAGEASKDLAWYMAQVRKMHRNDCDDILSQLRKVFPDLVTYEKAGWVDAITDHKFWRGAIEYVTSRDCSCAWQGG